MLIGSLVLEILIAGLIGSAVLLFWLVGRREKLSEDPGWGLILSGFLLLLFGALVDISDHFPELGRFVFLGRTPLQSVAEKMVGFFGGFLLLAVGLFRWLPQVAERRRLQEKLRLENDDLQEKLRIGSQELHLNRMQSEKKVRQHEKKARRSENLVEAVASGAPVALLAADSSGKITVATGRALAAGDRLVDHVPLLAEPLSRALQGETVTSQFDLRGQSFQARCIPWQDDETVFGAVVVGTDITDLVAIQGELRHAKNVAEAANQAKSHFLAGMSHELRTPLNSVIGFANLLEKNKDGHLTEKDLRFLGRISENGKHLLSLINEILDLSKIEAGQLQTAHEPVDLAKLIREVAEQMAPQARAGVRFGLKLGPLIDDEAPTTDEIHLDDLAGDPEDDDVSMLETDAGRLRQILVNLTANALKFTHEGKVVLRLHRRPDGRPAAMSVSDTGIGIPSEHLERIFDAFQQVDTGTARRYTGTGLGLSITRSLCDLLGFELSVESREGEGSTFTVTFS